jgi:hypothetical protein
MVFLAGDLVANLDARPAWKDDDRFAKIFSSASASAR